MNLFLALLSILLLFESSDFKIDSIDQTNPFDYFSEIEGKWVASPTDSSFVTELEYLPDNWKYFVPVKNMITSKEGKIYVEYEGMYTYDPANDKITFKTITKNDVHTGTCAIAGDTLFHYAQIAGTGDTKSYSSAIIKQGDQTLLYYANYNKTEELPELEFINPLVYQRSNDKLSFPDFYHSCIFSPQTVLILHHERQKRY